MFSNAARTQSHTHIHTSHRLDGGGAINWCETIALQIPNEVDGNGNENAAK